MSRYQFAADDVVMERLSVKEVGLGPTLALVLVSTTAVGPLLNHALSAAAPLLVPALGISEGQFGVFSSLLFISAACGALWLGKLSDVLSLRVQVVLNYGGAIIALILASIGPMYGLLVTAALLGGLTQAIANPTTNRMVHRLVPPARRPVWVGIKQSGVQVSQVLAGLTIPGLVVVLGWTGAALVCAALVTVLLVWTLRHLPPEEGTPWRDIGRALRKGGRGRRGKHLARLPRFVWYMTAAAFLAGAGTQATNVYATLFATQELAMTPVVAGVGIAVAGAMGIASRVWWGSLVGRGLGTNLLLMILALGATGAMASMLVASVTQSIAGYWIGIVLHGCCVLGTNVVITTAILQTTANTRVGHASGAITMGMYAGFTAGPVAMGLLVDGPGSFPAGWTVMGTLYMALLALTTCLTLGQRRA